MSISSTDFDVLVIWRDEGAKSDYDEDGGCSLMNSYLYDGYTCSNGVS